MNFVGTMYKTIETARRANFGLDVSSDDDGWTITIETRGAYYVLVCRDESGFVLGNI